jgi:hypothetical protein
VKRKISKLVSEVLGKEDNKFVWTDRLDGVTSGLYRLRLNKKILAFHRRESGKNDVGEIVELPPGEYTKGAAYITSGADLIEKSKDGVLGYSLTPKVTEFLRKSGSWYPSSSCWHES